MSRALAGAAALSLLSAAVAGCGAGGPAPSAGDPGLAVPSGGDAAPSAVSPAAEACAGCHPAHAAAFSLGVHAYAADDPLFVAMNARAQRETGGALGDFCVRCHAPLALAKGATRDGLDLASVPSSLRGVTCVVCHTAQPLAGPPDAAGGDDDAFLSAALAAPVLDVRDDGVMRGPIADPIATPAHASTYAAALDRAAPAAADLCGACHAVENLHGVAIERTIDEWRTTTYAQPATLETCGRCHMPESGGLAADVPGAPARVLHDHEMPAVDVGAGSAAQVDAVQRFLDPAIAARLCVVPGASGTQVTVTVDNALVGHAWPSGATQDRRAWVQIVATAAGAVVYASGVVADGQAVAAASPAPLVLLRERLFDGSGAPTPFLWNASSAQPDLLAPASTDPALATRTATAVVDPSVDRVESRLLLRAVDHDVTDALVASGDLAPAAAAGVPTLSMRSGDLVWTADRGAACLP